MQICLMRHGAPKLDLDTLKKTKVSSQHLGQIVHDYEMSGLSDTTTPTTAASKVAATCGAVWCSDLPRAIESVKKLKVHNKTTIDAGFKESAMPYLNTEWPRFSFFTYCILLRIAWFFGFSKNGEAIGIAKKRAAECAAKLQASAEQHGDVMLLGHGIMNRLIASALKRDGWVRTQKSDEKYWAFSTYEK